eukprot:scaffold84108_cov27-Tisochrysis_lutea.AAC.3
MSSRALVYLRSGDSQSIVIYRVESRDSRSEPMEYITEYYLVDGEQHRLFCEKNRMPGCRGTRCD